MMAMLLAACAFSAALLLILCLGDPKRRRSIRQSGTAQGAKIRRLLTAASLLPGIIFLLMGDAAAFLIWLGGYAVAGWLITLSVSASGHRLKNRP